MNKMNLSALLGGVVLLFLFADSSFAQALQTPISAEKKVIIMEIFNLTNLKKFTVSQKISSTTVENVFYAEIDADKDLTDAQRQTLRKQAIEAKNRIEKRLSEFSSDENMSAQLFEDAFVRLFDENFTKEELDEIVAFYRTPTGQKNARFMTTLLNKMTDDYGKAFNQKMKEFLNKLVSEELKAFKKQIQDTKVKGFDG